MCSRDGRLGVCGPYGLQRGWSASGVSDWGYALRWPGRRFLWESGPSFRLVSDCWRAGQVPKVSQSPLAILGHGVHWAGQRGESPPSGTLLGGGVQVLNAGWEACTARCSTVPWQVGCVYLTDVLADAYSTTCYPPGGRQVCAHVKGHGQVLWAWFNSV